MARITRSQFWKKLIYITELVVALSAALLPILVAGAVLLDRDGRLLGQVFTISSEYERTTIYIKSLLVVVAFIATAILSQRFLHLERIKALLQEIQEREGSDDSISSHLTSMVNYGPFIDNAQAEIVLIGINLTSFLGTYRERINAQLAYGRKITVAIIDHNEANLDAATRRSDVALSRSDYYKSKIETTILEMRQMAATAARHGYRKNVNLILLPYAPTFSIKAFDPNHRLGTILVEIYPHRTADSPPILTFGPKIDDHWYAYFRDQMDTMLESGRPYDLDD